MGTFLQQSIQLGSFLETVLRLNWCMPSKSSCGLLPMDVLIMWTPILNKLIMWAPFSNRVFGIDGARRSIQLLRSSFDDVGSFLLQRNHVGSLMGNVNYVAH
jgi:hypothetical protein